MSRWKIHQKLKWDLIMNQNSIWLITMGSWEFRFLGGLEQLVKAKNVIGVTIIYSKAFLTRTQENRSKAKKILLDANIQLVEIEIDFENQISSYLSLEEHVTVLRTKTNVLSSLVQLDISTMPRELIWLLFTLGDDEKINMDWVYFPPKSYDTEWLTRDPDLPRMALRKSGVTRYGKQTALVVVTGFDVSRTLKAISYFEPGHLSLGIQIGEQYENLKRNADEQKKQLKPEISSISTFDIDAYSSDHGMQQINDQVKSLLPTYNVLLTSLGPKPSAVTVYKVAVQNPEIGLFYVPAREYNENYSDGILLGKVIKGALN